MNKKQLIVIWVRKISAFTLDLFFIWLLLFPFDLVIFLILGFVFGKGFVHGFLSTIEGINRIAIIILYFLILPKKIGNTFGRKLLKIQDKFNLFWTWPFLRKDR